MLLLHQTFFSLVLGERKMSKNEMINRVRSYALKHGISKKEFRKTVMDFKAKSRVTGEEFHPKNIFKIIKDMIEKIKRGKLFYYQIIISVTI